MDKAKYKKYRNDAIFRLQNMLEHELLKYRSQENM
jgi:hypothetical protein